MIQLRRRGVLNSYSVSGIDADAQAFLTAASISDPTITTAINDLVVGLKSNGIWSKMVAIYPLVGGTAATHKFNLKDPRDLDEAFRLTFIGSPTHDANGITYNGTTQYANTYLAPNTHLAYNNNHMSFYSRSNVQAGYDMGASDDFGNIIVNELIIIGRFNTGLNIDKAFYSSDGLYNNSVLNTDTLGLLTGTMNGTDQRLFRRSSLISNATTSGSSLSTRNIYLGAVNGGGTASFFAARNYAFNTIGNSLTDADVSNLNNIITTFQKTLGRNVTASDTDAQAFVEAAGLTDSTQVNAIDDFVISLKTNNLWNKMVAIYPFIGGTAASHKWNLKDPRDLDAAYRLSFVGSPTHTEYGMQGNGSSQYVNTYLNPSNALSLNNASAFFYSNLDSGTGVDFGAVNGVVNTGFQVNKNNASSLFVARANQFNTTTIAGNSNNGFFGISRTASSNYIINQEGSLQTVNLSSTSLINLNIFLAGLNVAGSPDFYSNRRYAFYCFGEGLDSTEQANLKTAVETLQTTLGRGLVASDSDAQAFVSAAGLTDVTQVNAVDKLVIDLKANNLWDKMRAVYPFVGGTANAHKFNLKDPRDANDAYRLTFFGSPTHDANGVQGNGTSQYANTHLVPSTTLSTSSAHFSKYNRTNDLTGDKIDGSILVSPLTFFQQNYSGGNAVIGEVGSVISYTPTDTRGLLTMTRTSTSLAKVFRNNSLLGTNTSTITSIPNTSAFLMARNSGGVAEFFNTYQAAFASFGDGLTDADVSNLNNIITTFQTTLGRNV